ncbi:MAG TPA: sulfite exporter TauE/SafE family protein [Candidatus Hydrogenedentes bacterium]|nr:sulfite exporter TauE/SafE family protein [Candidatus Hydrogenedentota bacterium]
MGLLVYVAGMLLLGIGVGLFSAALGLGGGLLMVPAFIAFVPHMDEHTAKGTSLFIIIFVSLVNAWRLNKDHVYVPWRLATVLGAGSIVGSYLGAWITTQMSGRAVIVVFIVFVVIVGIRTLFLQESIVPEARVHRHSILAVLIGLAAGAAGGATGTGGGAVLIPLALAAGIVSNARAVGLSNMVMVATSIAGSVAHFQAAPLFPGRWTVGHVALSLAPLVFVGAQLGSIPGVRINALLSLPRRRVVMAAVLLLIAGRLTYRVFA